MSEMSPSTRREWIEIGLRSTVLLCRRMVSLHTEGVD